MVSIYRICSQLMNAVVIHLRAYLGILTGLAARREAVLLRRHD
jgi:hypothetical protein